MLLILVALLVLGMLQWLGKSTKSSLCTTSKNLGGTPTEGGVCQGVFGQSGFTTNTAGNPPTASNMWLPGGVTVDASGGVYVADSSNSRVLYFPYGSSTATRVYGQGGSFTSAAYWFTNGISANSLKDPAGLALDSGGNLYVVDQQCNRVLYFPAGTTTATRVYGQGGSFATCTANNGGISANSLNNPTTVAVDGNNNVYVTDMTNNRVLEYPSGSTTATTVFGQLGSFTTNVIDDPCGCLSPTASDLYNPNGVAVDGLGDVFINDQGYRILEYLPGSTTASRVYGQSGSFVQAIPNNGGSGAGDFNGIWGLTLDPTGGLYVADPGQNRVMFFPPNSGCTAPNTPVNCGTATRVYGQQGNMGSWGANSGGLSATSLNQPIAVGIDSQGNVYIVDYSNNRVIEDTVQ